MNNFILMQSNPTIGDITGNTNKIIKEASNVNIPNSILITPELSICGYPPKDLLLKDAFIDECLIGLQKLINFTHTNDTCIIAGVPTRNFDCGMPLFNSAAVVQRGTATLIHKRLLPNYDVFNERRYFEPSSNIGVVDINGEVFGITICEDIWHDKEFLNTTIYQSDNVPLSEITSHEMNNRISTIINISASPFIYKKPKFREDLLKHLSKKYKKTFIYVNQVGGNDDLVFDGGSMIVNEDSISLGCSSFKEITISSNNPTQTFIEVVRDDMSDVWNALKLGTRDYIYKNGFKRAIIGLSGGIDSALVACVASHSIDNPEDNIITVMMPTKITSEQSLQDAKDMTYALGIRDNYYTSYINDILKSYASSMPEDFYFKSGRDVSLENLQARIRGSILMTISNQTGAILLTTGNKSEITVGYCTLYGDMCGGFGVISDIPKTMVFKLCEWLKESGIVPNFPNSILTKKPTAELAVGQFDENELPPYDILDSIIEGILLGLKNNHIEEKYNVPLDIIVAIKHKMKMAEFKRKQMAPGIKITDRSYGSGWIMPIAYNGLF